LIDAMTEDCVQFNTGLVSMAKKDLAAFAHAVNEVFGSEHARQSVEDWIDELEQMDTPAAATTPGWRHVTIAAAARLARRIKPQESSPICAG
jgi:hypothetical protein